MTPSSLIDELRARGVVVGLKGSKLKFASHTPLSPADLALLKAHRAALIAHLEQSYAATLTWASNLLSTHPHVWLESPAHVDKGGIISSQFKEPGPLAARRIWLDTWGLWFILTAPGNEVLESRGIDHPDTAPLGADKGEVIARLLTNYERGDFSPPARERLAEIFRDAPPRRRSPFTQSRRPPGRDPGESRMSPHTPARHPSAPLRHASPDTRSNYQTIRR